MSDYTPISCRTYDDLVLLIMRRQTVTVHYRAGDAVRTIITTITDLNTRNSVEYAMLGSGEEIRLDDLLTIDGRNLERPGC